MAKVFKYTKSESVRTQDRESILRFTRHTINEIYNSLHTNKKIVDFF